VKAALDAMAAQEPDALPLERWITAPGGGDTLERLDVYANMYFYRLLDVLRQDYPKIVLLVGDRHFHNLITDYLLAYPSDSPSVRHVGRRLPAFLRAHGLSDRWPYLADLAALEWTRGEVFDAADQVPLAPVALADLPPAHWSDMSLSVVPSLRTLELLFPAQDLWRELEQGREPAGIEPAPTSLLVWRQGFLVYHRTMPRIEVEAFRWVAAGAPFGEICERLSEQPGETAAAERAFGLLTRWLSDGLLAGFLVKTVCYAGPSAKAQI
jgi:hypothetical protein